MVIAVFLILESVVGDRSNDHAAAVAAPGGTLTAYRYTTLPDAAHACRDLGMATAQLILQATALGLHVHAMAGFYPEATRETLAIPDGFEPVAAQPRAREPRRPGSLSAL